MKMPQIRTRSRRVGLVLATAMLVGFTAACSGGSGAAGGGDCSPAEEVTTAYQPGLGYAGLLVTKHERALEKALPDTEVKWLELNSGAAIRDGILAGEIDIGSGGIGPFLVGYDSGVDWKVLTGLNNMDLNLMSNDPGVESIEDLEGKGSIAMPGPDSIQSVVLRKGAEEFLGDPKALDSQIVAMGHPDGVQALLANQISAHLTSPPFQAQEAESGAEEILSSYEVFGEHTFNSVFTLSEFEACNPEFSKTLVKAVQDANTMLTDEPAVAAKALAAEMGAPAKEVEEQLTEDDVAFTSKPTGFEKFAEFMQSVGLIQEVPETQDLFFDNKATQGAT